MTLEMYDTKGNRTNLDPEKTVLLHGTSLETAVMLLDKGKITLESFNSLTILDEGYMYFSPNVSHFLNHELNGVLVDVPWTELVEDTARYAGLIAFDHCISSRIGSWPAETSLSWIRDFNPYDLYAEVREAIKQGKSRADIELQIQKADSAQDDLNRLVDAAEGFSKYQILELLSGARNRKGVILGINEGIFELNIVPGKDQPDLDVRIYLPDGLNGKYVNGIVPLGNVERRILTDYFK